ncbi:MAG: riboflavin synthase [Solirubrobacteraceae bacterium]|jgi:riboflavin synthase
MFTGLIADLGEVTALHEDGDGATLEIATRLVSELGEGDSIAVNGVCLTATEVGDESFAAQAMRETLDRSALGSLALGARVNLEMSLRAADRLGGHVVQGHVDGTGTVGAIDEQGFARVLRIDEGGSGLGRYLVEKGSIAVNGVSLTVSALHDDGFEVSLIPETLRRTNLGTVVVGDKVNLEADVLAKHVERLLEARS